MPAFGGDEATRGKPRNAREKATWGTETEDPSLVGMSREDATRQDGYVGGPTNNSRGTTPVVYAVTVSYIKCFIVLREG